MNTDVPSPRATGTPAEKPCPSSPEPGGFDIPKMEYESTTRSSTRSYLNPN